MKLGNILTYKKGKAPQKIEQSDNYVIYLSPEYLRGKAKPTLVQDYFSKVSVNSEDLLLLWDGSNAGEFFKGREGVLSSTMVKFNFDPQKYNRNFLFYQLKNFEDYLKSQTNGSGIPHVDKEILLGLNVYEFASSEQTRIAQILSQADEAIAHTEALIAKYQRIKTGLMQDLLTRGIDEQGQIRSETTHPFKDSPLGRIPEEWEVVTLGRVCNAIIDCPHSTPIFAESGVLVARTFNIKNGFFILSNASYVSESEYKERISRLEPIPGDIIFTREAPVGEAFVIPKHMKICLGQRVMLLRVNALRCLPEYLLEAIYAQETRKRFDNLVGGTTTPHLNVAEVKELIFKIPDIKEQNLIVKRLNNIRDSIQQQQSHLTKLQSMKRGLMQDLLSGRVRVGTPQTHTTA